MQDFTNGLTKDNYKDRLESIDAMIADKSDALDVYGHNDIMIDKLCDQIHELKDMRSDIENFVKRNNLE